MNRWHYKNLNRIAEVSKQGALDEALPATSRRLFAEAFVTAQQSSPSASAIERAFSALQRAANDAGVCDGVRRQNCCFLTCRIMADGELSSIRCAPRVAA